jgi:hypothetical protein
MLVMSSEDKRRMEDLAIEVRAGYKSFGRDSRRVHVMKNFNMSVPRGNIYGLLGTSIFGCYSARLELRQGLPAEVSLFPLQVFVFLLIQLILMSNYLTVIATCPPAVSDRLEAIILKLVCLEIKKNYLQTFIT